MLNKDQYNQDEYNDYYAQETRGAEISHGGDEGSNKKIAFIFLLLLLIIALGYFGWKKMNSSTPDLTPTKVATQTNSTEDKAISKEEDTSPKEVSTQEDKIAKQVQNIASSDDSNVKMNPEDIANIVQMVMMQMNQEKSKASSSATKQSSATSEDELQDNKLMESLSGTEVDSLSSVSDSVDSISESDNSKSASSSATANTYNKVVLSDNTAESDALSQLSDEISSVIDSEDTTPSSNNSYTQSITKEVKTRTREMRYIVVKKGDTLGKIAKRAYGNAREYKKIYEANPDILRRPDRIYIGQKLRIP